MKYGALIAAFFLLFTCFYLPDYADAARMGGGRSFGGSPRMNQPAQMPDRRQATTAAAPAAQRPGMFGGMGGMLGGLLAGTMLGSLLSGNGFGGGGGGFMDIILIAILAFIGWKVFTRFRNQRAAQQEGASSAPFQQPMQRSDAGSMWNNLRNSLPGATPQAADPGVDIPASFNQEEFLRGAKMAYTRMQKSWDNRDLADIAQFATPAVMRELEAQARQDPGPSRTELLKVDAELVGVEPEGDNLRAQVLFDTLMREDPSQTAPENTREIWHFLRIGQNGNWKLDGIQQVQ